MFSKIHINRRLISVLYFFSLLASTVFSQENTSANDAYLKRKDAVFLVNQSIFLDQAKVKNIDLFKKLEIALGRPILNQYFPISNGTAFLVSGDGYLITAAHVVRRVYDVQKNDWAFWSFTNYVSKHILPGIMTRYELRAALREFQKIAAESDIVISLKGTDKKEYLAQALDQSDDLDLALLKIELSRKQEPIPIIESVALNVGDRAMAIGYPLTFIMDQFLDDFKPTITNGIISALRNDKWDIQHTATINPGNSGGPLLTPAGELMGVNVGLIQNANNVYFAINANRLIAWLKQIGREGILEAKSE